MARQSTTREERAAQLIEAGAVTLFPGQRAATVRGSGRNVYQVTHAACTCPDFAKRGLDCKHRIAVRHLCSLYRACEQETRVTGRTRLPAALGRALTGASPVRAARPVDWDRAADEATRPATAPRPIVDQDDLFPAQTLPDRFTRPAVA